MSELEDLLKSEKPLPCPACDHPFRLPAGFAESSAVACPHCKDMITGQQIMAKIAPTAEIVLDKENEATVDESVNITVETTVQKTAAEMFDEQDFVIPKPLKTATQQRGPRTKRKKRDLTEKKVFGKQKKRKRRSSRNRYQEPTTATEMIKIVFGALLALPLAQLILWWGFQADPLNLAQPTSKIVAFIVPPTLRALPEVEPLEETEPKNKDLPPTQSMKDFNLPRSIKK